MNIRHTLIWRPGETVQNLESPGLSGRVDNTGYSHSQQFTDIDSNQNNVKKEKGLKESNNNCMCSTFLGTFLCRARPRREFFYVTLFGGSENRFTMINFFLSRFKLGCGPQGFNSNEIHLFICRFEQVGINAEKFEKKRTRFNNDVFATRSPLIILNHPTFKPRTLMIEGGNYHDSLEELIVYSTTNCGI